jgi:hypothetical protein
MSKSPKIEQNDDDFKIQRTFRKLNDGEGFRIRRAWTLRTELYLVPVVMSALMWYMSRNALALSPWMVSNSFVHTNIDKDHVDTAQVVFEEFVALVDVVMHHMIHADSYDVCLRAFDMVNRFLYVVFMKGVDVLCCMWCS